jgi:rhamnosyltransferase
MGSTTKTQKAVKATVFIPTYNGEPYIRQLLEAVLAQKLADPFEVLVIDSGSRDNTVNIVSSFNDVRLHTIPNSEFGHGKTRNLAARMAHGEYMVYLSQDAVPAHNRWLEFMLEPFFISPKVAGVFGKQIPRPHADITTKREVDSVFNSLGPDHSIMIQRGNSLYSDTPYGPILTFYSDVNSAVKRDFLLNTLPYRDVPYSEDQLFGKDALDGGFLKAYSPHGSVMHSNEYGLRDYFYRKFDENMGLYKTLGVGSPIHPIRHTKRAVFDTLKDIRYTLRDKDYSLKRKSFNILTCWYRNVAKERAAYLVARKNLREKHATRYSLERRRSN